MFATRQLYRLFWDHRGKTTIQIWCLGKFDHISVLLSFVWNEDIARFYYICCIFLDIGYIYNCKAHFREGNFSYVSLELSNLSKKLNFSSLGVIFILTITGYCTDLSKLVMLYNRGDQSQMSTSLIIESCPFLYPII